MRRSTALYRALFDDLSFDEVDQVAEGDRVASRLVLTGTNRGRRVRLWGITISRLRDGRIVEEWSAFDSVELLRQLGLGRTLLAALSSSAPPSVREDGRGLVTGQLPQQRRPAALVGEVGEQPRHARAPASS